jgi:MerR family transcriptional regulator, light-induced transcriptional regulator
MNRKRLAAVTGLQDGLTIGELARRTGIPAATLRSWEDRYGFPAPQRLEGGHRRYRAQDADLIEAIVRLRAAGMSLPAAIGQATAQAPQAEPSVFAGLRRRHPGLVPQVLGKATLLALTRAIEDECCAQAERPVLYASFQQERHFRQSERRWNELARTAELAVVFAAFPGLGPAPDPGAASAGADGGAMPVLVPLGPDAPLRREWTLICDAPDQCACVTGWEFPGQQETADAARRFEVIWSADPQVVRDAASICAGLARSARPSLAPRLDALTSEPPPPASADLRRATGLLTRMTAYLDG